MNCYIKRSKELTVLIYIQRFSSLLMDQTSAYPACNLKVTSKKCIENALQYKKGLQERSKVIIKVRENQKNDAEISIVMLNIPYHYLI